MTPGPGLNLVYFDNEPFTLAQTGYIEVCNDAGDQFVSASTGFQFTITDHAGVVDETTLMAGQCSGPLQVAAGNAVVSELPGQRDVRECDLDRCPIRTPSSRRSLDARTAIDRGSGLRHRFR